jgi:hypothetical protein
LRISATCPFESRKDNEARIIVDTRDYQDLDQGYVPTIHKSQGSAADRRYILAFRPAHVIHGAFAPSRCSIAFGVGMSLPGGQGAQIDLAEARQNFNATRAR